MARIPIQIGYMSILAQGIVTTIQLSSVMRRRAHSEGAVLVVVVSWRQRDACNQGCGLLQLPLLTRLAAVNHCCE